jgi:pSer/pThr/pTyr-binding forkhead associated (FHA) protein
MPDYAISKRHAIIELRKGIYLLKDNGSTNGTFLNRARVQAKPVEIHDRDLISFARYEFTFFSPESLYDTLKAA